MYLHRTKEIKKTLETVCETSRQRMTVTKTEKQWWRPQDIYKNKYCFTYKGNQSLTNKA